MDYRIQEMLDMVQVRIADFLSLFIAARVEGFSVLSLARSLGGRSVVLGSHSGLLIKLLFFVSDSLANAISEASFFFPEYCDTKTMAFRDSLLADSLERRHLFQLIFRESLSYDDDALDMEPL